MRWPPHPPALHAKPVSDQRTLLTAQPPGEATKDGLGGEGICQRPVSALRPNAQLTSDSLETVAAKPILSPGEGQRIQRDPVPGWHTRDVQLLLQEAEIEGGIVTHQNSILNQQ
jgi:hypothetical protein